MRERIRQFDWSATPLGPINQWPQSLRTVVDILLSSRYAMWMAWGPDLTMLYNDAYQPTLGIKHPRALGTRASEVWAEIWADIGPRIETVLTTGEATYDEGLLLFLERSGFPEETYHTFSYSPLTDDDGRISGMLCVVTEETDRVIGERRVESLRDVASALASTNTEEEVLQALSTQLSLNQKDLPFSLTYLFDENGEARLGSGSGISSGHPLVAGRIEPFSNFPWPAHQILLHPAMRLIESLSEQRKIAPLPTGDWKKQVDQAAIVPIRQQGQEQPAGFFVVGTNPYRRYDSAYSGFVDLIAGQIAAGLGNARAYEAERRRAEALAEIDLAKTTFFSNVSHELRTPLTLMLSPVEELLSQAKKYSPEERDLLDLVHRNGLRLQKLVNTLLEFTRIEAGRVQADYEPMELGQFTEELAANFRSAMERAGLGFNIDCEPLPEPVYVDREMWEKVVLNLLSNALKFTFAGSVSVALKAAGRCAQLTVRDTGSGIPALELPHIFDRFHRVAGAQGRTIEGTGIGLALVQELVNLHAGSIRAESQVSKGTTFTVEIPLGSEHLPPDKVNAAKNAASPTSRSEAFVKEALRWLSDGDGSGASAGLAEAVRNAVGGGPSARTEQVLLAADMREYITRLLGERYRVVAVSNGQMLEKKFGNTLEGKASQYLGYCIEGAHRMETLLSGLLAYSQVARTPDWPPQSVDVGEVLESVIKNLSTTIEETGAEISTSVLPVVQGEPVPLVLLFQNLVSNALKYRGKEKPRVRISASRMANQWRFAIEDNGIGIPKEFQSQIFGIFKRLHSRAEYSGAGIGLAICQKIVERNGGRIWVESEPGSGSTFFFTLPYATNEIS